MGLPEQSDTIFFYKKWPKHSKGSRREDHCNTFRECLIVLFLRIHWEELKKFLKAIFEI